MRYLYCHPLFDERKCAHRFSFHLKNAFHASGLTLNRFDYRGTGEAEGRFSDVSLETLRQDIVTQINGDNISLIGLRFGASLAFDCCACYVKTVRKLILVEPLINGAAYVDHLYRKQHIKNLMTGKFSSDLRDGYFENLEGYKTSFSLIEQIKNLNLINLAKKHPIENSIFLVQISKRSKIEPELLDLAQILKDSAKQVVVENVELPMFWERIPSMNYTKLIQKLLRWCCD